MEKKIRAFASLLGLASTVKAGLISEQKVTKTLVLVDDWATVETHSLFFDHVRSNLGHEIEYAMASQGPSGKVKHHDAYYFDNMVMMAPSIKESDIAEGLGVTHLNEFLSDSADHNLLVFADAESKRHARKLANNLGVDFEAPVSFSLKSLLIVLTFSLLISVGFPYQR